MCLSLKVMRALWWAWAVLFVGNVVAVVAYYVNPPVRDPFTGQVLWEPPNPIAGLGGVAFLYTVFSWLDRQVKAGCEEKLEKIRQECVERKLAEYIDKYKYPESLFKAREDCGVPRFREVDLYNF